jgi:hypothetical protein
MPVPLTSATIAAFGDPVLAMPPGLDERQSRLAHIALANIPPPPRRLPPRLVETESLRLPVIGVVGRFIPGLIQWLRADVLVGARGIADVTSVTRRAADAQGNSLDLWQVSLHYIVDDVSHRLDVRAAENDAADARNARVLPIVVDLARPSSLIVWWSALDIR